MADRLPATEPVTINPPRRVPTPTIRQEWKDVAFVHWPIEPAAVGRLLPRRVRPDVLDGTTYVGLIGLRVRTSLGGVLPVPWLGTFDETHLRLYSVDQSGHRGGVFLTLNADRLITAAFARSVLRIPYTWSPSTIARRDDVMTYATTRRWPNRPTTLRFAVRIGEPCPDPTPLERFVTARWSMHSSWLGQTMRLDATHPPWPLFRADLVDLELPRSFLDEVGLERPDRAPASVLWSLAFVRTSAGPFQSEPRDAVDPGPRFHRRWCRHPLTDNRPDRTRHLRLPTPLRPGPGASIGYLHGLGNVGIVLLFGRGRSAEAGDVYADAELLRRRSGVNTGQRTHIGVVAAACQ